MSQCVYHYRNRRRISHMKNYDNFYPSVSELDLNALQEWNQ